MASGPFSPHFRLAPAVLAAAMAIAAPSAGAQLGGPARPVLEWRAEAVAGAVSSVLLGGGVQVPAGTYFRVAMMATGGLAMDGGRRGGAGRVEAQGRFHLDPYRESRHGLYGIGGLALTRDRFRAWQPWLVLGAGVELPSDRGRAWALEAALAGGLRLAAVLRGVSSRERR